MCCCNCCRCCCHGCPRFNYLRPMYPCEVGPYLPDDVRLPIPQYRSWDYRTPYEITSVEITC